MTSKFKALQQSISDLQSTIDNWESFISKITLPTEKVSTTQMVNVPDDKVFYNYNHIQVLAALTEENKLLRRELSKLNEKKFTQFNNEECWIYEKGVDNHLESLSCPVVISAKELKKLLSNLKEYEDNITYLLGTTKDAIKVVYDGNNYLVESLCLNYIDMRNATGRKQEYVQQTENKD